jgi:hypothetical protein
MSKLEWSRASIGPHNGQADCQVLIVGAGPTRPTLAGYLDRFSPTTDRSAARR